MHFTKLVPRRSVFDAFLVLFFFALPLLQQKCYKYWPEIDDKSKAYGDFVVRQDQSIVLPYYTIRSFKIVSVSAWQPSTHAPQIAHSPSDVHLHTCTYLLILTLGNCYYLAA